MTRRCPSPLGKLEAVRSPVHVASALDSRGQRMRRRVVGRLNAVSEHGNRLTARVLVEGFKGERRLSPQRGAYRGAELREARERVRIRLLLPLERGRRDAAPRRHRRVSPVVSVSRGLAWIRCPLF